jgi:L-ribulose-5-phosphate 3-epimerase
MKPISFMTANFVARELDYRMTRGWGEGAAATAEYFRPEPTFEERFGAMLDEITPLGFSAIDLWTAHLDPAWASPTQIEQAASLLAARGLTVTSLAHYVSGDLGQLEAIKAIASAVGTRIIGGGCAADLMGSRRPDLVGALEKYDLVLGFENHPEKSADELLAKIGDEAGGRIGVAIDTGWFGTQRNSAASVIRQLGGRIVHVHLKDIHEPEVRSAEQDIRQGQLVTLKDIGHETCTLGDGCVGIEDCVVALKEIGYSGGISIEHEPEDHSPMEEIKISLQRLRTWLAQ